MGEVRSHHSTSELIVTIWKGKISTQYLTAGRFKSFCVDNPVQYCNSYFVFGMHCSLSCCIWTYYNGTGVNVGHHLAPVELYSVTKYSKAPWDRFVCIFVLWVLLLYPQRCTMISIVCIRPCDSIIIRRGHYNGSWHKGQGNVPVLVLNMSPASLATYSRPHDICTCLLFYVLLWLHYPKYNHSLVTMT